MKDRKLKLYHIRGDYINYLKSYDNNVQNNYDNGKNKKPYVGIVLKINNQSYFAPLTSPKDKHLKLKNSDPTTFKIKEHNNFYGSILLNNMIPVKDKDISKIDIHGIQDKQYKNILNREHEIILKNSDKIKNKAEVLYHAVVNKSNKYFSKVSCDFLKLEKACDNYQQRENNTSKNYDIRFEYAKTLSETKKVTCYNVLVNGVHAKDAIKQDSNVSKALTGLANHKDIKEKGITEGQLKNGVIYPKKLEHEIKVTRPADRIIDSNGNKIESKKVKSSNLEL